MGRPLRESRTPTSLVPALLRFAQGRGVDASALAARFGLTSDATLADDAPITPSSLLTLFETVAHECGEPWLGLRLATEPIRAQAYAPLELLVRASRTVADALEGLAAHAPLVHPGAQVALVRSVDGVQWIQRYPSAPRGIGRYAEEYSLAFVLARCREACSGEALHAGSVWLSHARPRDVVPLQRFFGTTDISFGADHGGFTLTLASLEARFAAPDDRLLATARHLAAGALERQAPVVRTTALVLAALPGAIAGGATLEGVGRALGLSERTLQRRLEEEGTTFLEVVDGYREQRARALLASPSPPLLEIAEQLGFADLATFSRAFKRWTGWPPGLFRRKSVT